MKRVLTAIIVMTGIFFWGCEDPADELYQDVESGKSVGPNSSESGIDGTEEGSDKGKVGKRDKVKSVGS